MGKGIETWCDALRELSPADREYLLVVACGAVGHSPKEEEPEVASIDLLRQRMDVLVEEVRIDEPFLVQGLLAYLIDYWTELADPDATSDAAAEWTKLDEALDEDLITPKEAREHEVPDESLLWAKGLANQEKLNAWRDRRQAEKVLNWLRRLREERLNKAFWRRF